MVVVVELGEFVGDELGLIGLVVGVVADDFVARPLVAPQLLGLASDIAGNDGVGGVEDRLGRAIVLLEHHHGGVGERLLELEDVADVGTPEGIDGLVGITHDGDLTVLFGELEHKIVLDGVGVLIFVDEDVTEAMPP